MKIVLRAHSSSGDPYAVEFRREDGKLSVFCECSAGERGMLCKHKIQLMDGDDCMLADPRQVSEFQEVRKWVTESGYSNLFAEVDAIESEMEVLKKLLKAAKKAASKQLMEGI